MHSSSPISRNSPLTVTTTTRYETTTRNLTSPRNVSLSPIPQSERISPVNYVSATTQRVASPINMHRVTSPITTITHKITTPLTSPLTVKVGIVCLRKVPMHWLFAYKIPTKSFHCFIFFLLFLFQPSLQFTSNEQQTGAGETYKMTEKLSTHKTSSNYMSSDDVRRSPSYPKHASSPGKYVDFLWWQNGKSSHHSILLILRCVCTRTDQIDSSSNVRVSGAKHNNASRRDSWDVINKTKNILSHNSLESLNNMTERQMNTDLSYGRPRGLDSETEYNTRYNKFELNQNRVADRRGSDDITDRYKLYS